MLNEKIQVAFNEQVNRELYSAYLYLSMSSYFNSLNLKGFENWMKVQTQEEMAHAMKFFNFITDRGGRALLKKIEGPQTQWKSPLEAFKAAYKHEQFITSSINDLVTLARKEKDYASEAFLNWFVTEQVEEEANTSQIASQLELFKDAAQALYMLDKELGIRVFTPPPAADAQA